MQRRTRSEVRHENEGGETVTNQQPSDRGQHQQSTDETASLSVPILDRLVGETVIGRLTLRRHIADEMATLMRRGLHYRLDATIKHEDGQSVLLAVSIVADSARPSC